MSEIDFNQWYSFQWVYHTRESFNGHPYQMDSQMKIITHKVTSRAFYTVCTAFNISSYLDIDNREHDCFQSNRDKWNSDNRFNIWNEWHLSASFDVPYNGPLSDVVFLLCSCMWYKRRTIFYSSFSFL